MPPSFDAVLLITFGGPTKREEIRPFLDIVLQGRPTPRERVEEVVHHYEAIGGASPINAITERQAELLRKALTASGPEGPSHAGLPVYVGMRNWHPFIGDVLERMVADGVTRVIAFLLAAHRSEASVKRYTDKVDAALARLGPRAPAVAYVEPWFDHPLFIEALAARIGEALPSIPEPRRAAAAWIFTAHSIPEAMAGADVYQRELRRSIELVGARLGRRAFSLAYQSRSGDPRTPWLGPDVGDAIRAEAAKGTKDVLLVPIGFVADHVEILYDLDIEAKGIVKSLGVNCVRAKAVGDHPEFIRMMADVVMKHR